MDVSAHAKDIWTSTDADLSYKLGSARWAVTCTASGYRHLQALSPNPATVHLSYHGLDLTRSHRWTVPAHHAMAQTPPIRCRS